MNDDRRQGPGDVAPGGFSGYGSPTARHGSAAVAAAFALVLGLVLASNGGCGGANFGSELAAQPKPRAIEKPDGGVLRVPQEQPLSIALPSAQKAAGLGGEAQADAHAAPDGKADASASVATAGQATATFQLGHAVQNGSERQLDLDVRVRYRYEYQADASPPSSLPDAFVGLKLYARDSRNRLLHSFDLVQHSTEDGAADRQADDTFRFRLTLGPGEAVNVFFAGQARVETKDGRSASVSIRLSEVQMEFTSRAAPAVRSPGG